MYEKKGSLSSIPARVLKRQADEFYRFQIDCLYEEYGGGLPFSTSCVADPSKSFDCWSAYAYGNSKVKFVYKKCPSGRRLSDLNFKPSETEESEKEKDERYKQSISRARSAIYEIAICNEFTHFCTFTQDKEKRDRFDLKKFRKDLAQFVRNESRGRETKIKYLLIPEEHKDGAFHMHGLLMGLSADDLRLFTLKEKLPAKIKKALKAGEKIYNWERYAARFGYFTCTDIKNPAACSKYITKYVTKDLQEPFLSRGEHLYYSSQGLKRREVMVKNCYEKCPFDVWDFENEYVKVKEVDITALTPVEGEKI